jgi:U3 small nucleolar ribonucleoprotein component
LKELQGDQKQQIKNERERTKNEKLSTYQNLVNAIKEIRIKLEETEEDSSKFKMQLDRINRENKALDEENDANRMEMNKFESEWVPMEATILKLRKEAKIIEEI